MDAVIPAKTQASLSIGAPRGYRTVRNRTSTIEPPPSRAQDSKITLGDAGSPKVLRKTPPTSVKHLSLRSPYFNH